MASGHVRVAEGDVLELYVVPDIDLEAALISGANGCKDTHNYEEDIYGLCVPIQSKEGHLLHMLGRTRTLTYFYIDSPAPSQKVFA